MLPNLIIIGAEKCGTTSFHCYLSLHPDIVMSKHKELNYFNANINWKKGLSWYKSHFEGNAKVYGESSPHYTMYPLEKGVAERMSSVVPKAKLIYMVRNPIDRIISQYLDRVKGGQETRTISEALKVADDNRYFVQSKYFMQLEQYLPYYPQSNILILSAEELKRDREATLKKAFKFLGVDDSFRCEKFSVLYNVSDGKLKRKKPRRIVRYFVKEDENPSALKKLIRSLLPHCIREQWQQAIKKGEKIERPTLDQDTRSRLIAVLQNDVQQLRKFTGCDYKEWFI